MQFFYPWFLLALGTLAVPIIIHLFYFRRFKKVYFSSVRFLKEVKDETSARSKLKNVLVLLARLLALAFLVMAFAQPFMRTATQEKYAKNLVGIFVDNSFSMNALTEDIPLISKAKQKARNIVEAYSNEDRYIILTHDFQGRQMRLIHQDEALSMIDEIKQTASVHNLDEIREKMQSILHKETGNEHLYMISDFQKSICDLKSVSDTLTQIHLIPLQSIQENNLTIDSAWFDSPAQIIGQASLLKFKIHNYGSQPIQDARLSIIQNQQSKPLGTISIAPGESRMDTAQIIVTQPGWQEIQLEITDFPIQFDDKLYLTFNVNAQLDITTLSTDRTNSNLLTALQSLPSANIVMQNLKNINYASLPKNELIILEGLNDISSGLANEIFSALRQGSNVLVFPGVSSNLVSYTNFMNTLGGGAYQAFEKNTLPVTSINTLEFTFKDVYNKISPNMRLPIALGRYLRNTGRLGEESIMSFADGKPFLSKYKTEGGALYICSTPLETEWSDLSRNPEIFIPMIFRIALNRNKSELLSRFIGKDEIIEAEVVQQTAEHVIHLNKSGTKEDYIPFQRSAGNKVILDVKGSIQDAGIYHMNLEDTLIGKVAFNFNRKESDLSTFSIQELKSKYDDTYEIVENANTTDFESWIKDKYQGKIFWRWFILMSLIFLFVEAVLLRFWKT